jgi:tetratricopeptide (TPR) repeat protein
MLSAGGVRSTVSRPPCSTPGLVLMLLASIGTASAWAAANDIYAAIVTRYAAGDRAGAVQAIGRLSEGDLRRGLNRLRDAARSEPARCPGCAGAISLRAALMLHTDRMLAERSTDAGGRRGGACNTSPQAEAAQQVEQLLAREADTRDVARRWTVAMALQSLGDGCLLEALRHADAGLASFKNDPALLIASGRVHETIATRALQSLGAGTNPMEVPGPLRQGSGALDRHGQLSLARSSFEKALEGGADLLEARLRLGRVLSLLGKPEEARATLEPLLEGSRPAWLLYLAHLFLGQLGELDGDQDGAERHYRAAVEADPNGQVAAVALSHELLLAGDPAGSRAVLSRSLVLGESRSGDYYWGYKLDAAERANIWFADLREASRQ